MRLNQAVWVKIPDWSRRVSEGFEKGISVIMGKKLQMLILSMHGSSRLEVVKLKRFITFLMPIQ